MTEQEAPKLVSFLAERSECSTPIMFLGIKIALDSPKTMYLDTYIIFFNSLSYENSVKGKNQDSEITGIITSKVLKLSSSYTNQYLLAEFSRID